jgi:hypothetical protein
MILAVNRWARVSLWRYWPFWLVTAPLEIVGMAAWGAWQGARNVWGNRPWNGDAA